MVGEVIYKIDNKLCFIEGCSDAHDVETPKILESVNTLLCMKQLPVYSLCI